MSQQKDQIDQNALLRKRAQDLARVAKLEFQEKTAIKAEQLSEILKRIILFHEHGPIVSKGVQVIIQADINDVI